MIRSLVVPAESNTDTEFAPQRNITQESIPERMAAGDTFWVDIFDAEEKEIRWLEDIMQLHPAVVEDLLREDRRPALLVYPNYLFISLFQPTVHLRRVEGQEIHCLIGKNFFVTVRTSRSETVDQAYNRVAQNPASWRRGVAYFLYLTIQQVVDSYYPLLDDISEQLNNIESAILGGQQDKVSVHQIYRIKQQLISLRQMIAPQREVLANVIGEERLAEEAVNRDLFRHLYERLLRVYDVIDSQRDLSSNILDLLQSQESSRLANAVSRLTILSMIFLPLTFLIGLFELNFATTENPVVIPIQGEFILAFVVASMIGSAVLMVWFFRRHDWI